jgi:hypothetical protein
LTPGGSTHLHKNCTQNTESGTYISIKTKKVLKFGPLFLPCEIYPGIFLTTEEKARKNLRVVEKWPDIPVAV